MAGRTFGFVAAFAIPLVLARTFTPTDFGIYKQIFLLYATLLSLAQLGLSESLYFFIPQDGARATRAAANTLVALAVVGLLTGVGLYLAAPAIGRWLASPTLPGYVPLLSVFLALMLPATALEIVLVSRERYLTSAAVYAGSDVVRSASLVTPAWAGWGVGGVMGGAIAFAVARCAALVIYVWRESGRAFRLDGPLFKAQLAYAIPFAAAVTVDVIQLNWHQYAVASWFDPATFAVYSVGCLQIPLVDLLSTSACNVMMVTMGRDGGQGDRQLVAWYETVERLVLLLVPLACVLMLTSRDVIITLFTAKYAASAPVFTVTAASIALAALPTDGVLRVQADTRFLFLLSCGKLVLIATTIGWFVRVLGLPGAALVTVIATGTAKLGALVRIARLLRVPVRDVLPWGRVVGLAATAGLALVPAALTQSHVHLSQPLLVHGTNLAPLVRAVATGSVYAVTYFGVVGLWWVLRQSALLPAVGLLRPDRP